MLHGMAVHFRSGPRGFPEYADDVELLGDSIETILKTVPGERPYRPTFGCYLKRLLFVNMSQAAALRARSEVRRAIDAWEPRVIVDDVLIQTENNKIMLTVIWRPRSDPSRKSMTRMEGGG